MYDNYYNYGSAGMGRLADMGVWGAIAFVIAVIGGIVLYCTFLRKGNRGQFKGFAGWLYEFLHFRKMTIEVVLKITYLILAIFITLGSFGLIPTSFAAFIGMLIIGNLVLRILYELSMITIQIWRNTKDINNRLHDNKANGASVADSAAPAAQAPVQDAAAPAPETKICKNCGYVAEADEKFCRRCGSPLV